jgi:hypothetical protein
MSGERKFPSFIFGIKEDWRIGREEVWTIGGVWREVTLDLNFLSHKGSADSGVFKVFGTDGSRT